MTAGTVIFWRHGQTDYNLEGRLQGQVDTPLNETGRQQAKVAATALAQAGPTAILTSDLGRAVVTAQALGEQTGLPVRSEAGVRERSFGQWEGLTHPEVEAGWPEQFQVWQSGGHPQGVGAETRREVGHRVAQAVADAAQALSASDVLVVTSHGAAISCGISALLGQDAEQWRGITGVGNCHWSVLHHAGDGHPGWRLAAHNVGVPDLDFAPAARIV
ncbi:histidine phosphatase family protein [Ruania suaedae]|uniref:histidine phosphatase family protein n=1 Tax=Ruania suaedae TaxID=2897774 RepID=UPI001E609D14|nr:histidine phosphatase family protein [Ruania suaedae]UFU01942.1 histidine phosphatase family protein [Ruania suaedae]